MPPWEVELSDWGVEEETYTQLNEEEIGTEKRFVELSLYFLLCQ